MHHAYSNEFAYVKGFFMFDSENRCILQDFR
jgi:hypothetical protein